MTSQNKIRKIGILDISKSLRAKWFVVKYDKQPVEILSSFGDKYYGKILSKTITLKDALSKETFYIYPAPIEVCVDKSQIKSIKEVEVK